MTSLSFSGVVSFRNDNQPLFPMVALVEMTMISSNLLSGSSIHFFNTGLVSITLPPGFTATTSSGLPVVFAPVP